MAVVLLILFVLYLIYLFVYTEMKKSELERKLNKEFLERNGNKYMLVKLHKGKDYFIQSYAKNTIVFSCELYDSIVFKSYDETEEAMNKITKDFPNLKHKFYIHYLD